MFPEPIAIDEEVLECRARFERPMQLVQIVLDGARRMLQAVIEQEVEQFLEAHSGRSLAGTRTAPVLFRLLPVIILNAALQKWGIAAGHHDLLSGRELRH